MFCISIRQCVFFTLTFHSSFHPSLLSFYSLIPLFASLTFSFYFSCSDVVFPSSFPTSLSPSCIPLCSCLVFSPFSSRHLTSGVGACLGRGGGGREEEGRRKSRRVGGKGKVGRGGEKEGVGEERVREREGEIRREERGRDGITGKKDIHCYV